MDKDFEKDLELIEVRTSRYARSKKDTMTIYEDDEGYLYYKFIRGKTVHWEDDTPKTIFKSCARCNKIKNADKFYKNRSHYSKLDRYCISCTKQY